VGVGVGVGMMMLLMERRQVVNGKFTIGRAALAIDTSFFLFNATRSLSGGASLFLGCFSGVFRVFFGCFSGVFRLSPDCFPCSALGV
jgi:hypothetical protein